MSLERAANQFVRHAVMGLAALGLLASATPARADGDPEAGKAVYQQTCLMCHGAKGKGDGPAAAALNPKPMNFTDASRMSKISLDTRVKAVTEGGASVGASPMMPAFKDTLSPKQIQDVVTYVSTELAPPAATAKR